MVFLQHQSHLPSEIVFVGIRFYVCFLNKSNLKTNENVICSFRVSASASRTEASTVGGLHAWGRALTGDAFSSGLVVTHHWKAKALHSQPGGHNTITVT